MSIEELGEIQHEFKPGLDNVVAGIIIGLLMIAAGVAAVCFSVNGVIESGGNLPVWTEDGEKGWSWGAAGIFAGLGVGLVIGSIFLFRWIRSLFSFRIRVSKNGLAVSDRKSVRTIGWDDIASVREIHLYERPPVLKGVAKYVLPKVKSKSFVLKIKQGEPIAFDGNRIKKHCELAEAIKEETDRRTIPWDVVEVQGR